MMGQSIPEKNILCTCVPERLIVEELLKVLVDTEGDGAHELDCSRGETLNPATTRARKFGVNAKSACTVKDSFCCCCCFSSFFFLLNFFIEKVLVLILGVKVDSKVLFWDLLVGDCLCSPEALRFVEYFRGERSGVWLKIDGVV